MNKQCFTYKEFFVRLEGGNPELIPVEEGGDGIYTYVFDGDGKLYTAKVLNPFEINTLHRDIVARNKIQTIQVAGEFQKSGKKLVFNLLSGTYMKDRPEKKEDLIQKAQTLFGSGASYQDTSFITNENVPLTKAHLDTFKEAGYIVKLFKDRNACLEDPAVLQAKINSWKGKPTYAESLAKAEARLTGSYTLAGKRKLR